MADADLYQAAGIESQPPQDLYLAMQGASVKAAPPNKTNVLDDFLHVATGGLMDKVDAAAEATGIVPGGVHGPTDSWLDRYRKSLTNIRANYGDFEAVHPDQAKGAKAAGVIAPMLAVGPGETAAKTLLEASTSSAKTGAALGAGYGFGGTDDSSLAKDLVATGVGTFTGGAAGFALPTAMGIAKAPFRMVGRAGAVFGKEGLEQTAGRVIDDAASHGVTFEDAPLSGMHLTTGQSSNDPGLLWLERNVSEATPHGAELSAKTREMNNTAITTGIGQLGDADTDASAAMRGAVLKNQPSVTPQNQVLDLAHSSLGDTGFYSTAQQLNSARKVDAAPLYEKAFQGGSIAPLQDQLRSALTQATGAKGQIAKQIAAIEQSSAGALAARGAAGADVRAKYMDLQKQLAQAEADRQATMQMFQKATTDKNSNAPGAVWSPRIQQFLDDPILRSGIKKGMQIQKLEALAAGQKFNPTEYAVTGTDAEGNPIIGGVPNMRLLDAGKKGLDNIVEGYRNPITGKLALDQYGNAVNQVRAAYVKELDNLNPDYAKARAAWSGPSQSLDALNAGRNVFAPDSELTKERISSLSPGDMDYFKTGVMRAIDDVANNSPNGSAALNNLLTKPKVQDILSTAFGSKENFAAFRQKAATILNPQTDVGKVVATNQAGDFKLPNSGVADQFIRTGKGAPEAFQSYLDAISSKNAEGKISYDPDGVKAAQDAFAQKFLKTVTNTGVDQGGTQLVSPAKMQKFMTDYAHVINSPLYSPAQRDLMARIAKATQMASRTANARPAGGGDTFPKLQGDKFIDALIGPGASKLLHGVGSIGGAVAGYLSEGKIGAVAGMFGGEKGANLISKLYEAPREKVIALITDAMHDPQLAKDLMMKASNSNAKLLPPPRRAKLFGVLGAQVAQPAAQAAVGK